MAVGVPVAGVMAIGRILAVTLDAADCGWTGIGWAFMLAGLEAIGRILAVFGGSDEVELQRNFHFITTRKLLNFTGHEF